MACKYTDSDCDLDCRDCPYTLDARLERAEIKAEIKREERE
jgi:hypothetical protein